jgi:hypothetical protein
MPMAFLMTEETIIQNTLPTKHQSSQAGETVFVCNLSGRVPLGLASLWIVLAFSFPLYPLFSGLLSALSFFFFLLSP